MENELNETKTLKSQEFRSCPWTRSIELFLVKKSEYAKHKAEVSKYCAYYYERLKNTLNISSLILTVLLSPASLALKDNWTYLISVLILVSAILSGINTIFKFEYKFTRFLAVSRKYIDLANLIDNQLILDQKYRMNVNILLMEINFASKEISELAGDILEPTIKFEAAQRQNTRTIETKEDISEDFNDCKIEIQ
jgi:hypothetical protein